MPEPVSSGRNILKSLDQQRALYAWEKVGERPSRDYVNLAKGAPALIMANGLMQTLAFFQSKEEHHKRLARHIIGWVGRRLGQNFGEDFGRAMEFLHGSASEQYMRATEEALEILRWIRQFASARQAAGGAAAAPGGR